MVKWIRVNGFWLPDLEPMDEHVEVIVEGDWESYNTIYIRNESGRFWSHKKEPGIWKWQGYTFRADTAVDALHKLIGLVERIEKEGRV